MKLHPRVTRSVVELVKRFEGLRRQAAQLPDGGWTIGYGHTLSAREGAVVSPEDAEALLYYDLSEVAQKVEAWTFTPLNQNQFEALTALSFNIGVENFRRSTVLKRVNEGQHLQAASAFELWRKSDIGGEALVVDALVRRRAAEKAHYLTPPEGFRPSPTPVLKPSFDHSVVEAAFASKTGQPAERHSEPTEPEADEAEPREEAFPVVAATAVGAAGAATLATARLHQLFPDKTPEDPDAPPPPPFGFQSEPPASAEPTFKVIRDTPFGFIPDAPPELEGEIEAPPMPTPLVAEAPQVTGGFGGFAPPPVRQIETLSPFAAQDAPESAPADPFAPVVQAAPVLSPQTGFAIPEIARTMRLGELAPVEAAPHIDAPAPVEPGADAKALRLPNRTFIYAAVGVLGAVLFAAALFSMFSGKASPVNLVIGLIGILLMTPAGGYFLLNFLNRKDAAPQI